MIICLSKTYGSSIDSMRHHMVTRDNFNSNLTFGVPVQILKETLIRHGFTFVSDTDTEVIPKLAKFVFDQARDGEGIMLYKM